MPLRLNKSPPISQTIREMYFLFSYEFRSFKAFSAKHHVNNNWRSVWVKMFAIRGWADEGGLISFSMCSSTNFTHVRPNWLLKSNLFTSAFCCLAQFRRFLDTPRCSFFRQFSSFSIVSRAIHQEGAVFLVNPFSRGSFLICCPTLWCWLKCCMKQHIASSSGTHASFVPELQCVTWVQKFQCNSSQEPREKKLTLSPGERVRHQELSRWGLAHLVLEVLQQQFLPRSP